MKIDHPSIGATNRQTVLDTVADIVAGNYKSTSIHYLTVISFPISVQSEKVVNEPIQIKGEKQTDGPSDRQTAITYLTNPDKR